MSKAFPLTPSLYLKLCADEEHNEDPWCSSADKRVNLRSTIFCVLCIPES